MSKLDTEPEVIRMAKELGLDWRRNPTAEIIAFCIQRIESWLKEAGNASFGTITQVQRFVCAKLKLVIEDVCADTDIDRLVEKYAIAKGEGAFAHLREELNSKTFAVLMRREKASPIDRDQYVAVIDCRGNKAQRKFFTRWHEIAHMLTLYEQLALPLHRSQDDGSPLERLMDTLAGEVGFYTPLFQPILDAEIQKNGGLTFNVVEAMQAQFCAEASFQATLIACVKRSKLPAAYIEVGLGYKKKEERMLKSDQLLLDWEQIPQAKLRLLNVSSNAAAGKARILFHRNMEVPASSVISRHFHEASFEERTACENLDIWVHSDGSNLGQAEVRMQSRHINKGLIAIVAPTEYSG